MTELSEPLHVAVFVIIVKHGPGFYTAWALGASNICLNFHTFVISGHFSEVIKYFTLTLAPLLVLVLLHTRERRGEGGGMK